MIWGLLVTWVSCSHRADHETALFTRTSVQQLRLSQNSLTSWRFYLVKWVWYPWTHQIQEHPRTATQNNQGAIRTANNALDQQFFTINSHSLVLLFHSMPFQACLLIDDWGFVSLTGCMHVQQRPEEPSAASFRTSSWKSKLNSREPDYLFVLMKKEIRMAGQASLTEAVKIPGFFIMFLHKEAEH